MNGILSSFKSNEPHRELESPARQSYNILPKIPSHHLQAPHFASKPIIDIYTIFIPSSTPLEAFSPAIESFNYIKFQPTKSHKYKLSILQNTIHTLIAKTE